MSEAVTRQRLDWVDAAKGIGIILVVYGHVARGVFNAGLYDDQASYHLVDNIIYSFHMPLFFFLSGLFFVRSFNKRGAGLILSKVDTIFYAYIVWSFIQGLLEVFMSNYTNGNVTIHDVIVLLWQPRAQFWFLYTLFFVFVFNTVVFLFLKKINYQKNWIWVAFMLSFFMLLIKNQLPWSFAVYSVATYDIYFCIGILYLNVFNGSELNKPLAVGVISSFIVLEYLTYVNGVLPIDSSLMRLVLAVSGVASIVVFCQQTGGPVYRLISYIGFFSMEIYLMHVIFGSGFRAVMQKILHIDSLSIYLIAGTLVAIFLPILFMRVSQTLKLNFLFKPVSIFSVEKFASRSG